MHNILVYGDSMTWGIIPNTRNRFSLDERWPGVLENHLREADQNVRIIEDSLKAAARFGKIRSSQAEMAGKVWLNGLRSTRPYRW